MNEHRKFGSRLKFLRISLGLSIRGFASRLGCSHSQVIRWEQQSRAPKQVTLERLAIALECSVSELQIVGHENETNPEMPVETKRIPVLDDLDRWLHRELEESRGEIDRLRGLILTVVESAKCARTEPNKIKAAWMKFVSEASRIPLDEVVAAGESVMEWKE